MQELRQVMGVFGRPRHYLHTVFLPTSEPCPFASLHERQPPAVHQTWETSWPAAPGPLPNSGNSSNPSASDCTPYQNRAFGHGSLSWHKHCGTDKEDSPRFSLRPPRPYSRALTPDRPAAPLSMGARGRLSMAGNVPPGAKSVKYEVECLPSSYLDHAAMHNPECRKGDITHSLMQPRVQR
jgi:hypothetical protein